MGQKQRTSRVEEKHQSSSDVFKQVVPLIEVNVLINTSSVRQEFVVFSIQCNLCLLRPRRQIIINRPRFLIQSIALKQASKIPAKRFASYSRERVYQYSALQPSQRDILEATHSVIYITHSLTKNTDLQNTSIQRTHQCTYHFHLHNTTTYITNPIREHVL